MEEFKLTNLFNTNGSEQFNAKVFESNANYRLAIMEAVRIAYDPDDPCSSPEEAAKNASLYAMALKLIRKHEPVRIHSFFVCLGLMRRRTYLSQTMTERIIIHSTRPKHDRITPRSTATNA